MMSFLPPRHANSMLPISNWPNGWGRHSFLFSGAPGRTGSQEFGSRTNSTETEPFGSWMRAWRRPPRQRALLACAFSTPREFHVGFGIVVPSDEETTEFSIQGMTRNGRVPFRHSLAVTLYGDSLRGSMPLSPELEDAFTSSLAGLIDLRADSRRVIDARPTSQKARKRKRR